jgi:hypothetical protein
VAAPRPAWAEDARHFFGSGHAGGLRDTRASREVERVRDLAARAIQVALRDHLGSRRAAAEQHALAEATRQAAEHAQLVRKGKAKPAGAKPWQSAREGARSTAARPVAAGRPEARPEGPGAAGRGQQKGGQPKGGQQRASERRASADGSPAASAASRRTPRTA